MRTFMTFIDVSWIMISILGIYFAAIGWKQHSFKIPFILFVIYFALSLYTVTIGKTVNRWYVYRYSNALTQEKMARFEAKMQDMRVVDAKYPDIDPGVAIRQVNLPFGLTLLVVGLGLLTHKRVPI